VNLDPDTIGARLIGHMTTFNIGLKHYVNEFLFTLCDQDANEFVRQTGFGNAAGLLATHNLLSALGGGGGKVTNVQIPPPQKPEPGELVREVDEAVGGSDASSEVRTGKPMGFLDLLSEEEKEREAEKLMDLLQRLEANGMVKIFRNGEQPPGPDSEGGDSSALPPS
jgi:hypothetical protein